MRNSARIAAVAAAAGLAAATIAAPAGAAPSKKGTTFVVPSALTGSVLVKGDEVAKPGSLGAMGAAFGIVGKPGEVIKHVGGLNLNAVSGPLEIRNFWIDLGDSTVSAVVNDAFRAELFTFTANMDGSVTLLFTETASNAIVGSDAIEGEFAGTAKIVM